jgi:hypothetical protein
MITHAGSFLSNAANLIALMIEGDIMVRNCRRSSTAYFGLRFGGFLYSTIVCRPAKSRTRSLMSHGDGKRN